MQAAREVAQLVHHLAQFRARIREQPGRRGRIVGHPVLDQAQRQRERYESLLSAVVQIAFEPAGRGVAGLDDARPRRLQLLELGAQLGVETRPLQGERRGVRDRPHDLGLVEQRGVVNQGGDPATSSSTGVIPRSSGSGSANSRPSSST